MSIEVKPGRYRMRNGNTVTVEDRGGQPFYPWRGRDGNGVRKSWKDDGRWIDSSTSAPFDLIEYLGQEEQTGGVS